MAEHVREQIMSRWVALVTNLATTGANVYRLRARPMATEKVPPKGGALNVVQGADVNTNPDDGQTEWPFEHRRLEVMTEVRVRGTGTVEQLINRIEKEVIQAIQADHTLNVPGVERTIFISTSEPIVEEGAERNMLAVITHAVDYRTLITDPSVTTT